MTLTVWQHLGLNQRQGISLKKKKKAKNKLTLKKQKGHVTSVNSPLSLRLQFSLQDCLFYCHQHEKIHFNSDFYMILE